MTLQRPLTIGKLAARAGVGVETVRFYERRGLLAPPARRPSGYRLYGEEAVRRLTFIRRAKDLGFSLDEIGTFLELGEGRSGSCGPVREVAARKIGEIERKIALLRSMRDALAPLVESCPGDASPAVDCPILESLEADSENADPAGGRDAPPRVRPEATGRGGNGRGGGARSPASRSRKAPSARRKTDERSLGRRRKQR